MAPSSRLPCLQLSRQQRQIVAIGGGILLLSALLLRLSAFIFTLAAALFINSFSWPLASRLRQRGIAPLAALSITYAASVAALGLLLLAATPAWQCSGEEYAAHLTEAAEILSERLIGPVEEPTEPETDPGFFARLTDEARQMTEQLGPGTEWTMERLLQPTAFIAANRIRIFFQTSILLALIIIFPIVLGKDLDDPTDKLQAVLAFPHRLTRWLIIKFGSGINRRLFKALIPATILGAGIKASGLEVGLFLAVITFILSLFIASGGIIGIILSGPVVFFEPFLLRPLLVLGILLVVLFLLERHLHWRLISWPKIREEAEKHSKNAVYPVFRWKSINWLGWLRNAFYLFILLLIGYVLYSVVPPLLEQRELENQLASGQNQLADGSYSLAAERFTEILGGHPEETRVLLGLVKAHTYGESPEKALEYAEKLDEVAARPKTEELSGLRERLASYLVNLIYSPSTADPVEAYEIIDENIIHEEYPEITETVRERLNQAD